MDHPPDGEDERPVDADHPTGVLSSRDTVKVRKRQELVRALERPDVIAWAGRSNGKLRATWPLIGLLGA